MYSLIGSRLEDIKAAADVIDTFKSSTRNEELAPMGKAETRIMYVCMHVYTYAYLYERMYVCMYVCM